MSKAHRGRPLKKEGNARGVCPITNKSGVKLLYEHTNEKGEKIKISKVAYAEIKNKARIDARKAKKQEAKAPAPAPSESPVEAPEPVAEAPVETTETTPPETPAETEPVAETSVEATAQDETTTTEPETTE